MENRSGRKEVIKEIFLEKEKKIKIKYLPLHECFFRRASFNSICLFVELFENITEYFGIIPISLNCTSNDCAKFGHQPFPVIITIIIYYITSYLLQYYGSRETFV